MLQVKWKPVLFKKKGPTMTELAHCIVEVRDRGTTGQVNMCKGITDLWSGMERCEIHTSLR